MPKAGGFAVEAGLAAAALALGLWGSGWGLPSRERLTWVLPPGLDTPAFRTELEDAWRKMHERLGINLMLNPESFGTFKGTVRVPAGWTSPPEVLLSSARSFHVRSAQEDEQSMLLALSRLKPWKLELNPHLFTYGGAYLYTLGAWLGAGWVLRAVPLHQGLAPYLEDPGRMAAVYRAGRLLSAAAAAACAVLLTWIGRRYLGGWTGTLAAALFLVAPATVGLTLIMKQYTFWCFLALLTVERCLAAIESGRRRDWILAGAASGLAVGASLTGWPACLTVGAAAAFRAARGRSERVPAAKGLGLAALASAAAFFLTNPFWALSFREALAEVSVLATASGISLAAPFGFLFGPLLGSTSPLTVAFMLIGVCWAVCRAREDRPLAFVVAAFVCALTITLTIGSLSSAAYIRYGFPVLPLGLLLGARLANDLCARGGKTRAWTRVAVAAVGLHLGLNGALYAYNFSLDAGARSTHRRAGLWIEEHVPAGDSLGLMRLPQPSNSPYFRWDRYDLRFVASKAFAKLPASELPRWVALTSPEYDDKKDIGKAWFGENYELAVGFERPSIGRLARIHESMTAANPRIEVYRLKGAAR